jgi:hypothetical protein
MCFVPWWYGSPLLAIFPYPFCEGNNLPSRVAYQDPGASYYEEQYRQRVLHGLRRRAKTLGYDLMEITAVEGVS